MSDANRISRRDLLRGAGVVAAAGALSLSSAEVSQASATQSDRSAAAPRTLALIGDRYHNPDYIRVSLDRLFKELGLPIDYTMNYYDLSKSLLAPYQLFVSLRDNMIWPGGYAADVEGGRGGRGGRGPGGSSQEKPENWITEEQGEAVKDFVAAGNGFYSLHDNSFVSRASKNYREVQGGIALGYPPARPFKVRIVNNEHPVTQGVQDFMVTDEQIYHTYDKDPKEILLRGENVDRLTFTSTYQDPNNPAPPQDMGTTSITGWAHEYGKGRVVFTALGHSVDAMWQPEHLKLQKNAVRWLLKMA